jgi:phospholipase/lecithinase/hemolysin
VEGRCSEEVDQLVAPFNARVRGMLDGLNAGLPGATFTYLDNYRLFTLMLASPASYGASSGIINKTDDVFLLLRAWMLMEG